MIIQNPLYLLFFQKNSQFLSKIGLQKHPYFFCFLHIWLLGPVIFLQNCWKPCILSRVEADFFFNLADPKLSGGTLENDLVFCFTSPLPSQNREMVKWIIFHEQF